MAKPTYQKPVIVEVSAKEAALILMRTPKQDEKALPPQTERKRTMHFAHVPIG